MAQNTHAKHCKGEAESFYVIFHADWSTGSGTDVNYGDEGGAFTVQCLPRCA